MAKIDIEKREKEQEAQLYQLLADHASPYSVDDRLKACMLYAAEGNMAEVSRKTGLEYQTLKTWKTYEWWPVALDWCRRHKQDELDGMLTGVIQDAVLEVADRIKEGDWIVKKDGGRERLPMKGREIAITLGVLYDKRALIRGQATSHTSNVGQDTKLKILEDKFKQFANFLDEKTIEGAAQTVSNEDSMGDDDNEQRFES